MNSWKYIFVLWYCSGVFGAPSNTTENASTANSAEEVIKPDNMNIADYYYSIFGKHLDYDYKEPLVTFDQPVENDLSEDIESEVDKPSTDALWDIHSRKKRFIIVPANYYNATRSWVQQVRRLRMERRRLRLQRRQRWQANRINYLNTRSESLRKQATRLTQLQQRQQTTRSVPVRQQNNGTKTTAPVISSKEPTPIVIDPIASESNQVPVKQVPVPTKT